MAGQMRIERGAVIVGADASMEITMSSGFLFVLFTGARYSHMYHISYWNGGATPISVEFPQYIEVTHEAKSNLVTITNKTSSAQNIVYLVIA